MLDTEACAAVMRCTELGTTTLAEFMGPTLHMEMEQLAELPGTPGAVMTAQFAHYARSSVDLLEAQQQDHDGWHPKFTRTARDTAKRRTS